MKPILLSVALVLCFIKDVAGQFKFGEMHNNVQVCTADTDGWVRRGVHLRQRGDCEQGYVCSGDQIIPLRDTCPDGTYYSVHTGVCSFPNVFTHYYGSFNCTAEEEDPNLDYQYLKEKREAACQDLMSRGDDPDMKELYVEDPDNCRIMFKCPLTADHDEWIHWCPPGMRFIDGEFGPCGPDTDGCGVRGR